MNFIQLDFDAVFAHAETNSVVRFFLFAHSSCPGSESHRLRPILIHQPRNCMHADLSCTYLLSAWHSAVQKHKYPREREREWQNQRAQPKEFWRKVDSRMSFYSHHPESISSSSLNSFMFFFCVCCSAHSTALYFDALSDALARSLSLSPWSLRARIKAFLDWNATFSGKHSGRTQCEWYELFVCIYVCTIYFTMGK